MLPARSMTDRLSWCTPSLVTSTGDGQAPAAIADCASEQVKVTVAVAALCQPAALAVGSMAAVIDGAVRSSCTVPVADAVRPRRSVTVLVTGVSPSVFTTTGAGHPAAFSGELPAW